MGAKSSDWRTKLLGSLQGQLQLATYVAVFLGFTGASFAGLWVSDRNLNREKRVELIRSAEAIEGCLLEQKTGAFRPNSPQTLSNATLQTIRNELTLHSSWRISLWIEQKDGSLLLLDRDHPSFPPMVIEAAMAANPTRVEGLFTQYRLNEQDYLSQLHKVFPSGRGLWVAAEIASNREMLSNYLAWMILIWGTCLLITLSCVSWLVKRIVKPLRQLSEMTENITAKTLQTSSIKLKNAPTEVAQLANTYRELLERLSQSWDQQRQFVSAVSHELRTPLTIIKGYLHRTLRRGDNLREEQIKGLRTAEEESTRVKNLLDDLLDLSRSDSGRLNFSNQALRLSDLLQQAVEIASSNIKRPLRLELPQDLGARHMLCRADPDRLRQILLDLIENADKYSPPGRPVTLRLTYQQEMMQIEVEDHGIGIPEAETEKIFNRFFRASNSPPNGGSGLGLSVVKLLVEGMGGTITVNSKLDQGSCFTIRLPPLCSSTP
ncbi:MAG TPA: ATP-binding protein [Prochlorococcaceae cyanobacterium Fu_MAG_50]|nr:ATP-binding protein [Prochlorococcaceae cyanobacterium Fu_MAG_50]